MKLFEPSRLWKKELKVAYGTEAVASAGEAFEMIIKGVTEISEEIQEMSAASEEMAASAETALESIEDQCSCRG